MRETRNHEPRAWLAIMALSVVVPGCAENKDEEPEVGTTRQGVMFKEPDGTVGLHPTGALTPDAYDWRSSVALLATDDGVRSETDSDIEFRTVPSIDIVNNKLPKGPAFPSSVVPNMALTAGEQAVASNSASGWLAGPDLLVTSLHALVSKGTVLADPEASLQKACRELRVVFTDGAPVERTYNKRDAYRCKALSARGGRLVGTSPQQRLDFGVNNDWVVLQLDRPVEGRTPLEVGQAQETFPEIYTAGHPLGNRMFQTPKGVGVRKTNRIDVSLSAVWGQSGSPVVVRSSTGAYSVVGMVEGGALRNTLNVGGDAGVPYIQTAFVEVRQPGSPVTRKWDWWSKDAFATRDAMLNGRDYGPTNFATEVTQGTAIAGAIAKARAKIAPANEPARTLGTTCAQRLSTYLGNAASDTYEVLSTDPMPPTLVSEWIWLREGDRTNFQFGSAGDQATMRIELHPRSLDGVQKDPTPGRLSAVQAALAAATAKSGVFVRHWKAPVDGWYRGVIASVTGAAKARGRIDFVSRDVYLNDNQSPKDDSVCEPSACFGAVGSDCQGVTVDPNLLAIGSGRVAPCDALPSGMVSCKVAVASERHDTCCALAPDGFMCGSNGNILSSMCRTEFLDAIAETGRQETWKADFDPTDFFYVAETPRLTTSNGRPRPTNALRAPEGTVLQKKAVDDGWCATLTSEAEVELPPNVPVVPTVTDRRRCRNVIAWGDETTFALSASAAVAPAISAAPSPGFLQAALHRNAALTSVNQLTFGFELAGTPPMNVQGWPANYSGDRSGRTLQAIDLQPPGTLPGASAALGLGKPNPTDPGAYKVAFKVGGRATAWRYYNAIASWQDPSRSPIGRARVLSQIAGQNLLASRSSDKLEIPVEVVCKPPVSGSRIGKDNGWGWQVDRKICECPLGQEWSTQDGEARCLPECGCGKSRDANGSCIPDENSNTTYVWSGSGLAGTVGAFAQAVADMAATGGTLLADAVAGGAKRTAVACCPPGQSLANGVCAPACSAYRELYNGRCVFKSCPSSSVRDRVTHTCCLPGQMDPSGACVCPSGSGYSGGGCLGLDCFRPATAYEPEDRKSVV